jgi:hypothetical protein
MSTMIPNADALVSYIKQFTGSTNDAEIKQCIFLAEMSMRNLEIPALRTDPWTTIGYCDEFGALPIPADMLKPIVFFQQGTNNTANNAGTGPWIVYDRIGERDMITQVLVQNLYLNPVNIAQVVRGQFAEIGQKYNFSPLASQGDAINMYYYTTWPLLFSQETAPYIASATGTITTVTGTDPYAVTITDLEDSSQFGIGEFITATAGTGFLTNGLCVVTGIVDATTITATSYGTSTPAGGSITNITITDPNVQTNVVLQSWPEGYIYGTLREYYLKRKMADDAAIWAAKFDNAWNTIEDQNSKGKWSGGHNKMWSVWQPRQMRRYATK